MLASKTERNLSGFRRVRTQPCRKHGKTENGERRRIAPALDGGDLVSITHIVGAVNAQGPPVPIPNTEVKLCSAEDTSRETARENRSAPTPRKGEP